MSRIKVLAGRLPGEADAALVAGHFSRRYLTGFPSSAGMLVVTRGRSCLIVDSRYHEAASQAVEDCEVLWQDRLYRQMEEVLASQGAKTVAVEGEVCTVTQLAELRKKLPGITFLEDNRLSDILNDMRQRKTPEELEKLRAAQAIGDRVFTHILGFVRPGVTEAEIALELDFAGRRLGARAMSFDAIVASGPNSSRPHHVAGNRQVQPGDFVTMDFGFLLDGYCSDMTRTVAVGQVGETQRRVYQTVLDAQNAAFAAIGPGAVCKQVDKAARDLIDATEFQGRFGHGLGHSLGLEIHEPPNFNTLCDTLLQPGMCLSVEPGIYLPGAFGVRIEDVICCTQDGFENLMHSPKELIVL